MTAEALARSLGRLSDSMVEEALHARKARCSHPAPWLRAAACIAVAVSLLFGISFIRTNKKIVTAPGILTVTAFSVAQDGSLLAFNLAEASVFSLPEGGISKLLVADSIPLQFYFPQDENIKLNISTDQGVLHDGNYDISNEGTLTKRETKGLLYKNCSLDTNRTLYWQYWPLLLEHSDSNDLTDAPEATYIDILLTSGNHIVGFAVIEISIIDFEKRTFTASVLESVAYPKINGKYQKITKEYVVQQIELCKSVSKQGN